MSKAWFFNFLCVLMICSSSHGMNFVFNMGSETRLMRNIRNASEFLNKNGWTMFITGTAVAALCCYDKPVLWHAGVVGFNGLLMYKFIQMQKQMNSLAQQLEETNTKTIEQNEACQSRLNNVTIEQGNQKKALEEAGQKIDGFLPKLEAHTAVITERLAAFDKKNIEPLRADVEIASATLNEVKKSVDNQGSGLVNLNAKFNDLYTSLINIRQKQEDMAAEHKSRFAVIEEKIETGFEKVDASIATSFGEIKKRLEQRGVAWQGQKSIGFGRQTGVGTGSSLHALLELNTSTP